MWLQRVGVTLGLGVGLALGGCTSSSAPQPRASTAGTERADTASPGPIARFWTWFEANAARLLAQPDLVAVVNEITAELAKVDPGVVAEIGGDTSARTLELTADGIRDKFPVVTQLHAAHPTVPGWTIVAFRQRRSSVADESLQMNGHSIKFGDVRVATTLAGAHVDVALYLPGFTTEDEMGMIGLLMLDAVLGEYDVEMKVGELSFAPIAEAPATAQPLLELPAVVDKLP